MNANNNNNLSVTRCDRVGVAVQYSYFIRVTKYRVDSNKKKRAYNMFLFLMFYLLKFVAYVLTAQFQYILTTSMLHKIRLNA